MSANLKSEQHSKSLAFGAGALIGTLGGLVDLGGAEFRLPVLISLFRFRGLEAVILNKATSLVVVATALPFRASTVPFAVGASWPIIVNLLAGSLAGTWVGAGWASRLKSETLYRVIAVLLVLIAGILVFANDTAAGSPPPFTGVAQMVAGIIAGFVIGVIASLLADGCGEPEFGCRGPSASGSSSRATVVSMSVS